jgi:uncharacterized protein YkwD
MKWLLIFICVATSWLSRAQAAQTGTVCLSAEERKLYDLIIAYRRSKKLPAIALSAKLTTVAQAHVRDLSEQYNNTDDNPCNPHSWSDKGQWTPCCYTGDHRQAACMWRKPLEIAAYEGNGYEIAYWSSAGANAVEGLEGWKKSAGHNPLLINSGTWKAVNWQAIGVGIYKEYAVVWFGEQPDNEQPELCR